MQQCATPCLPSHVYPVNELTEEGLGTAAMRRSLSEKLFCFCRKSFRSKLQRLPLQRLGKITAEQRIREKREGGRQEGTDMEEETVGATEAEAGNVNRKQTANSAMTLIFTCSRRDQATKWANSSNH